MKRVLKIVIPLILVLALLGTACWFFFFHRTDLTSDLFLRQADSMYSRGRYNRAIRYYSWAWALEPQNTEIPMALAETYVANGNYTKAEYTLVSAISSAPGNVDLYAALCKTYVAQDKLLDAVQMLDRTTDENVKAALNAMRPEAPVVSPENGYYSEYIEVTVESPETTLYATTNGKYPSTDDDLYTEPLTLSGGESTVLAIAVNEQGLVSPVTLNGYTIGGVVEPVALTDAAIDAAVREQLGLSPAATLMTDDLWSITTLQLPNTVQDLADLSKFTGLRSLTLQGVSGLDFTVLSQLPSLEQLDLSSCTISSNSLQAIGSLAELKRLVLNSCALMDIAPLASLTKLTELDLSNNSISDIGVISLMLELESVKLANNPITSIAGLTTCQKLQALDISSCKVASLGSLSGKTELTALIAGNNLISDLSDLADCRSLSVLEVPFNRIMDLSVLPQLSALTVFIGNNNNNISYIPDFDEAASQLQTFNVDYNAVDDLSGLEGIQSLNYVYADYNKVKDLMPLKGCINLIQVNVWDNPVTEESVEVLKEHSIIVNYNPNYEPPQKKRRRRMKPLKG